MLPLMNVMVNGESREIKSENVAQLLEELQLEGRRCAVMVNGSIVRKERRKEHNIRQDDEIDIITMVGGG